MQNGKAMLVVSIEALVDRCAFALAGEDVGASDDAGEEAR